MCRKIRQYAAALALCALGFVAAVWMRPSDAADKGPELLKSKIVGWDQAKPIHGDWGQMRFYFTGETGGTKDVLTAVAVVEPGKAVHKSHRHAEEEYLAIVEGTGIWSLDGKEIPAKRGDILYVERWVYHGLKNTGDKPLTFLVVRYNSKGVSIPARPDNRPDEM